MATNLQIPPHEVQRRLNTDNPWWRVGQGIDADEAAWPRRAYFAQFSTLVLRTEVRRAVVLIGPRRVGKTVMLKHLIARLLDDGVVGIQFLFLSLDTPLYSGRSLDSLVQMFTDLHQLRASKPLWVLFDEVQYLKDREVHLKSLVDTYPHIHFVASGSAAAALRMKSRESGAGRFTGFVLPPLTFAEYLRFAGNEDSLIRKADAVPEGRQDLEVDIVSLDMRTQKPRFAVQIKWSDRAPGSLNELRGLRDQAKRHKLARTPLVATRTHSSMVRVDGVDLEFMPVALHCYTIARNLLRGA